MRGKKGTEPTDPFDPPRQRANKRRGKGTDDNDRPQSLEQLDAAVDKFDCEW